MINPECEELMLECLEDFRYIDNSIYSDSMWFILDNFIESVVEHSYNSIFESDSSTNIGEILDSIVDDYELDDEEDYYIDDEDINLDEDSLIDEFLYNSGLDEEGDE